MNNIYQIRIRKSDNMVFGETTKEKPRIEDWMIFEIDGILEIGQIEKEIDKAKKTIIIDRIATIKDLSQIKMMEKQEKNFSEFFNKMVDKHKLDMKLVETALSFDEKRITFYYTADGRIDFRFLLKDLIKNIRKLIRLQQIGPRDGAQMMADCYGICGRRVCCQTCLKKLSNVNYNMANKQNLATVSTAKITGACGKLMCCLAYEEGMYKGNSKFGSENQNK